MRPEQKMWFCSEWEAWISGILYFVHTAGCCSEVGAGEMLNTGCFRQMHPLYSWVALLHWTLDNREESLRPLSWKSQEWHPFLVSGAPSSGKRWCGPHRYCSAPYHPEQQPPCFQSQGHLRAGLSLSLTLTRIWFLGGGGVCWIFFRSFITKKTKWQ